MDVADGIGNGETFFADLAPAIGFHERERLYAYPSFSVLGLRSLAP